MGKSLKGKELGIGITQRRDGRYSAKFTSKSGKRIEKYFDKLQEARKWLDEAKYEDTHGSIGSSTDMTVDAWFEYWIANIKSKTVRRSTATHYRDYYKNHIKELLGTMQIADVKPMHCQNVLNVMDTQGYAGSTMEGAKIAMSAMFSGAEENGIIVSNPVTKSVKSPKKSEKCTKVLTTTDQKKFLAAAEGTTYYDHYRFILQTGVRSGELRGIKWEDVDFENRQIHIRRSVNYTTDTNEFVVGEVKTNSGYRDIPMTQTVYDILMDIDNNRATLEGQSSESQDYVFRNGNGKWIPNSNYNRNLGWLCRVAEIDRISMHVLRHTFATRCIEAGMKPKTLQKILGHAKIAMTMDLYVHVTEDEKEKEMKKFEELCNLT